MTVNDYSEVRQRRAFNDAAQLTQLLQREPGGGDPQTWEMVGLFYWHRYIRIRDNQDQAYYDAAVSAFARCFPADREVPQRLHAAVLAKVANELVEQLERAVRGADPAGVSAAVRLLERVVAATPDDDRDRAARISNLSGALCARYERNADPADLEKAITLSREAIKALPASSQERAAPLSNLGIALLWRYKRLGALADLNAAIEADRDAADAIGDDPGRARLLTNLSGALIARFDALNDAADLNAALAAEQEAARALPRVDPRRALMIANLASAERARSDYFGERTRGRPAGGAAPPHPQSP